MSSAMHKVLFIPELLENILLQLEPTQDKYINCRAPHVDYCGLVRVCRFWQNMIQETASIRSRIFEPPPRRTIKDGPGRTHMSGDHVVMGKPSVSIADLFVQFGHKIDRGWMQARKTGNNEGLWRNISVLDIRSTALHVMWRLPHKDWRRTQDAHFSTDRPTPSDLLWSPRCEAQRWHEIEIVVRRGVTLGMLFDAVEFLRKWFEVDGEAESLTVIGVRIRPRALASLHDEDC